VDVSNEDELAIEEATNRAKIALEEGKKSKLDQSQIDLLEAAARFEMAKKIARKKSG